MKLIYEDQISVSHEDKNGGTITSLKKCPHGINLWNQFWDLSLCKECNQPERSKREDIKIKNMMILYLNSLQTRKYFLFVMRCSEHYGDIVT